MSYNSLAQGTALVALQALRLSLTRLSLAYNPLGDLCPHSTSERESYGRRDIFDRESQ